MANQAGKNVIAVLPDSFGNHDRRIRMDVLEYIHPHALAIDKSMLEALIVRMSAAQGISLSTERFDELRFHLLLRRPAHLVCRLAKISAGDQQNFLGCCRCGCFQFGDGIGSHCNSPEVFLIVKQAGSGPPQSVMWNTIVGGIQGWDYPRLCRAGLTPG